MKRKKKTYSLDKKFVAFLRREWWFRNPLRKEALGKAKADSEFTKSAMWKCSTCGNRFIKVYADHIEPVGRPKDKKEQLDWNKLRDRMWFGKLQVMCKDCHQAKTNKEKK